MDSINFVFNNNIGISYPSNYNSKQKTALSLAGKDILEKNETEINKEISAYLDILYKNIDDETILNKTEKMKLNNAYLPMKNQTLHYGGFFI